MALEPGAAGTARGQRRPGHHARGGRRLTERLGYVGFWVAGVVVLQWVFASIGSGRSGRRPRWYFWCDAWIFVGSIVATYAMARGWNDFWLAWIAVDLVGVPLLWHSKFYPSAVLYVVYGGLVVYGFFVWLKASREERARAPELDGGAGMSRLSTIEEALEALRGGRPVLVTDSEDRENEGDVVLAAQTLTDEWLAWTIRHTSGYLCAPVTADVGRPAGPAADGRRQPRPAAHGLHRDCGRGRRASPPGISAADRATTIRLLADPAATADSFVRPGHVIPLRAKDGGVLERPDTPRPRSTCAGWPGSPRSAAIGELVNDDGTMMRLPDVQAMGAVHNLPVDHDRRADRLASRHDRVDRLAETDASHAPRRVPRGRLPRPPDRRRAPRPDQPAGLGGPNPLVRLHSECLTGDAFGSLRCDCGPQLERSLERVAAEGGAIVYLRGHEGRGVGLVSKLQAYALQDAGPRHRRRPARARPAGRRPRLRRRRGHPRRPRRLTSVRLLTNNPAKVDALREQRDRRGGRRAALASPRPRPTGLPAHQARPHGPRPRRRRGRPRSASA